MSIFQSLNDSIQSYLSPQQCEFIERAYEYAYIAHDGVKRASGEPYITHPVAVAEILASMKLDHEALAAALLHDVLEDTDTTHQQLVDAFNISVADLVEGVTKLDKVNFKNREQAQAENIRKMLIAMSKDFRVMLIKLADRVHNMRTLGSLRLDKRRRIAKETFEIFTPIADRLGLHHLKNELEQLAFKAQNSARYYVLQDAITKARGNRKNFILGICDEISTKLDSINIEATVLGREKHLFSLYKKMQKKGCQFHDVMDVYAFRIVVKDLDTCYRVLGQMHHLYQPKLQYFKDYIAIPKANSYQSLHTTLITHHGVNIEIQIRTEDMDAVAKQGIAAHWSYKEGGGNTNITAQLQTRNWFQGLTEQEDNTTNSLVMLENIKQELGNNEIHVLTPQGKIIVLPSHATAVDFAYALHTTIGHRCTGVKIDKEFALLSEKLESGQMIEIITGKEEKPCADWLNFVATHKARQNIRQYLKQLSREQAIPEGRRLLKLALNQTNLTDISQQNIDKVLEDYHLADFNGLLHEIGTGKLLSILIARRLRGNAGELTESKLKQQNRQSAIKGTENMMISYANCCKPLPGDQIVAHTSSGKGLVVHSTDCHNVSGFKNELDKYIPVEWDMDFMNQYEYSTDLNIMMVNHKAGLAQLFNIISKMNANVEDLQTTELPDHVYSINLTLTVLNRIHLSRVIRKIKKLESVQSIKRSSNKRLNDRRMNNEEN
ncbi:guanosine-3',5'-bis(diphosphate) 3'-pyrophosphohydrolase [Psychromonas marina]|uniref:guanosine-3',5'-bis(diphosphate) 3'-diphosphatase n=1 Tax=Psychromonas marina TaxID=88364 RepID=A0ABQ6E011_9GAMM|nr:RelA/SpoT family protein [Psychromonas marina]GLS90685.1 guanosine-3',5'-bis(diphosphate) 3'-pyrophosphohydrolase [Psychromonas marina]